MAGTSSRAFLGPRDQSYRSSDPAGQIPAPEVAALTPNPLPLRGITHNLIALQAQALAAGEAVIAAEIGAVVERIQDKLGRDRSE